MLALFFWSKVLIRAAQKQREEIHENRLSGLKLWILELSVIFMILSSRRRFSEIPGSPD
jgi:hypothetical protein